MSQIARVFVVLNLLLAAGFLFAAGTFLGVKADWIEKHGNVTAEYRDFKAAKEKEIAQKVASIEEQVAANTALKTKLSSVEGAMTRLTNQADAAENDKKAKDAQIASLTTNEASFIAENKRISDELAKANESMTQLRAAVSTAEKNEQTAKAGETKAKAEVVERNTTIEGKDRQIGSLDRAGHEKDLMIEYARANGVRFDTMVKMEAVADARVLGVDMGMKLVQANVGANQKVSKGYVLDIVRGDRYIGRFQVDQVYPTSSAGTLTVLTPGETVRVGDRVTNTLN